MELTKKEWQVTDAIARDLAGQGVDRNELGKVIAYFRIWRDKNKFLELLARLPESEYVRSGQTRNYFRHIQRACERHLREMDDEHALRVVSWAFRKMTYLRFKREIRKVSSRR